MKLLSSIKNRLLAEVRGVQLAVQALVLFWKMLLASRSFGVAFVATLIFLGFDPSSLAQITNTPSAVLNTLSSNAGSAYDTFISLTVAAIAIGFVVYYARKAAAARH